MNTQTNMANGNHYFGVFLVASLSRIASDANSEDLCSVLSI